jgi:hypothetical protein
MKIVFINNVKIKPKAGKADDIVCCRLLALQEMRQ